MHNEKKAADANAAQLYKCCTEWKGTANNEQSLFSDKCTAEKAADKKSFSRWLNNEIKMPHSYDKSH